MTRIIKSVSEWRNIYRSEKLLGKKLGFVPTMGALHKGHASLVEKSVKENDITVVSIFVNPTQFNDPKDLQNYPRTFEDDLRMLKKLKADYLFYPDYKEIYSDNYRYTVSENDLSKILCGAFRPGHFDGVLTVIMKLLNIIRPNCAYFGEKDFQQFKLIEGMAQAFFLDMEIIPCPTLREDDGLAMSSRNTLLSPEERIFALNFPRILKSNKTNDKIKTKLESLGFRVDYIEDYAGRRLGAVHVGKVRLIDNVKL
jgi:pantoate--beta-alanine ligase